MRTFTFSGSHRAIGQAFGESCRSEIASLYKRRVTNALEQALRFGGQSASEEALLDLARRSAPATKAFDPASWEELEGIAAGSGLDVIQILAMNGLTDFRDSLAWPDGGSNQADGCTSIMAAPDATRDGGVIAGQTWDLATDNLPHVICVHRQPTNGPKTWSLTTDGCLSLIGMNEAGIGIGTTNLRTRDARAGVNYLSIIHRVLACTDFEDAASVIIDAPRAGAHYYWLVDGHGRATNIECNARTAYRQDLTTGCAIHANHALHPAVAAVEGAPSSASSLARQARLETLASEAHGRIDVATLESFFADAHNDSNAICRDDFGGINTNGSVILDPREGIMRVCHGVPTKNPWFDFRQGS